MAEGKGGKGKGGNAKGQGRQCKVKGEYLQNFRICPRYQALGPQQDMLSGNVETARAESATVLEGFFNKSVAAQSKR